MLGFGGGLVGLLVAAFIGLSKARKPPAPVQRLPSASAAVARLRASELGRGLEQIPATVIDQGVLRRVPYLSHRAGDVELNAYGDPDAPAGLEIGLFGDPARRAACRDALAELLADPADREALRGLDLAKGKATRGGLTLEITPETAPDAYGGWWVSAYDARALEAARAGDAELKDLSVPRPGDEAKRSRPGKSVYLKGYRRKGGLYVPSP
jgi:hypothetical protein